jgi:hypothetical protein
MWSTVTKLTYPTRRAWETFPSSCAFYSMPDVQHPAERGTTVMTKDELLRQRRQMRRRIKDVLTERRLLQDLRDLAIVHPDGPDKAA